MALGSMEVFCVFTPYIDIIENIYIIFYALFLWLKIITESCISLTDKKTPSELFSKILKILLILTVPPTTALPVSVATVPVYKEIWFIALMAILALIIIFIIIALCFGTCWRRKVPYIRERMPLQPRQKKANVPLAYVMEPYDSNLITTVGIY
jgi:hypothetical protein